MSINKDVPVVEDAGPVDAAGTPSDPLDIALPEVPPLADVMLEPLVRNTLQEDLGRAGDLTSNLIIPAQARTCLRFVARERGVLAGLDLARLAFRLMDPSIRFLPLMRDGQRLNRGDIIATVEGPARAILSAERTALNFMGHLSGVATATARIADVIRPYGAKVTCTRKTLPGLRMVQKYAVRVGGGSNHRYGLDDAILIKDNHIAACGGSIAATLERAKAYAGHLRMIEIEVDTLQQLEEALKHGPHAVLLDNMTLDEMREAVRITAGRVTLEASGGVTLHSVAAIAETGVDFISSGALTHSAPNLDLGLDVV